MSLSASFMGAGARRLPSRPAALAPERPGGAARAALPRIAGYRVERLIGRGRRTVVYFARDLERGCDVALKVAHRSQLSSDGDITRFLRECALSDAIAHPNVMRVFDHGSCDGLAYLAMQYASGGELAARIGTGLGLQQALPLLLQAASALGQLHQRGLVHRDVKPANLLLGGGGELLLADFGLACKQGVGGPPHRGAVVGTPRYASPEQSEGAPAQPSADVYSLGVVLYEMLSGRAVFPGETLTEVLCQHLVAPIPRLPPESRELQPLLDSMLAKDSGARLPDALAVLERAGPLAAANLSRFAGGNSTQDRCLT